MQAAARCAYITPICGEYIKRRFGCRGTHQTLFAKSAVSPRKKRHRYSPGGASPLIHPFSHPSRTKFKPLKQGNSETIQPRLLNLPAAIPFSCGPMQLSALTDMGVSSTCLCCAMSVSSTSHHHAVKVNFDVQRR